MTREYIERVKRDGRLNAKAMKIVSPRGFEFASYSYGVGNYVRLNAEIGAVLSTPGPRANFYNGTVRGKRVAPGPRGFTSQAKCLEAIEAEAIRQGIIDAEGNIIGGADAR